MVAEKTGGTRRKTQNQKKAKRAQTDNAQKKRGGRESRKKKRGCQKKRTTENAKKYGADKIGEKTPKITMEKEILYHL